MKLNISKYKQKYKKERENPFILKEGAIVKLKIDNHVSYYVLMYKTEFSGDIFWNLHNMTTNCFYAFTPKYIQEHRVE